MAYAIQTMADGSIKFSDGTIKAPQSSATNPNAANYQPTNQTPVNQPWAPGTSTTTGPSQNTTQQQNTQQTPAFNQMDPNAKPSGYWWDAANGWTPEPTAEQKQLSDGYDAYFRQLDEQMAGLDPQRQSQEQVAKNTFDQGMNTVNSQYAQTQQDLSASREKTLRDLSSNLQQLWQQGNSYLGTRGASDSSAANQYSYALAKTGNQQRGDVQTQYDNNMFKLKNTYDTEIKNLELSKNNQLQQIAQWYYEAQNALKSQKGQASLQKSQQALSMAMQMAQQAQQETASKRAALDQWAANNATSFSQLKGQLAESAQFQPTTLFNGISGGSTPFTGVSAGYGASPTTERDQFGNIIRR